LTCKQPTGIDRRLLKPENDGTGLVFMPGKIRLY
jgi:hypothetical protein